MVRVYDIKGKKVSTVALPKVFNTDVRIDLIKRAVVAIQSHRLQPYGPDWLSGKKTSAFSFGPGRGLSRIPRVTGGGPARGRGAIVPYAVGGRRAHPPVPEKVLKKRINKKEKALATASAIASTTSRELVKSRGHVIEGVAEVPLLVTNELEKLKRTKDVKEAFSKLGLDGELS
ncbi:MAG: 50S ribosomal protein L4, partial [Candidatus Hydrothermarchaeales archaeon]